MSSDGQEKTEEATQRRKMEARRNGQVAKSTDLVGALIMIAMVMTLPGLFGTLGQGFLQSVRASFGSLPTDASFATLGRAAMTSAAPAIPALMYLLLIAMAVGVFANVAQTGLLMSAKAITPSLGKLNPMSGIKRMLSARGAVDAGKALVKLLLFGYLAYTSIASNWGAFANLGRVGQAGALSLVGGLLHSVAIKVVIAWAVLAAIDAFFQRKQMDKQLRMSKDEVKQEHKEMEGSPEVKAARYQRRRKLMKMRTREAVKTADVIVTNPTHYAIAIKYEPDKSHAPIVVAKGVDNMAAKIREFAKESRVPIVPNPPLARALYKQCEVGDFVPRELFQAVAEVLAYVYRVLKKVKK